MSFSRTQQEVYEYCSKNDFIAPEVIADFTKRLEDEANIQTLSFALKDFLQEECRGCGASGAFKYHFLGRLKHPSCGRSWYIDPGAYIAEQFRRVLRTGIEDGVDMMRESEKKGERGGLAAAIFGFILGASFRLWFALWTIPLQAIVSLAQAKPESDAAPIRQKGEGEEPANAYTSAQSITPEPPQGANTTLREFGFTNATAETPPDCVLAEPLDQHLPELRQYSSAVLALTFKSGAVDRPTANSYVFYFFRGQIDSDRPPDEILTFKVQFSDPGSVHIIDNYLGDVKFGAENAPPLSKRASFAPQVLSEDDKAKLAALAEDLAQATTKQTVDAASGALPNLTSEENKEMLSAVPTKVQSATKQTAGAASGALQNLIPHQKQVDTGPAAQAPPDKAPGGAPTVELRKSPESGGGLDGAKTEEAAMFCTNCGRGLAEGSRFCVYCGTAVAAPPNHAREPAAKAAPEFTRER